MEIRATHLFSVTRDLKDKAPQKTHGQEITTGLLIFQPFHFGVPDKLLYDIQHLPEWLPASLACPASLQRKGGTARLSAKYTIQKALKLSRPKVALYFVPPFIL
jgi:hypothetical protein